MIAVTIKNPNHVKKEFQKEKKRVLDVARASIQRETSRLKKVLIKEIKGGAPGGRRMAQLGEMAKSTKKGMIDRRPLIRLAYMMEYELVKKSNTWFARLGYIPYKSKKGGVGREVSALFPKGGKISWARIMELQEAGFRVRVTERMRRKFLSVALGMQGKWVSGGRSGGKTFVKSRKSKGKWQKTGRSGGKVYIAKAKSPFFVKRASALKIPARPIIAPFWSAHRTEAVKNMKENFRYMCGVRTLNR